MLSRDDLRIMGLDRPGEQAIQGLDLGPAYLVAAERHENAPAECLEALSASILWLAGFGPMSINSLFA